jgi:hypothetical protein
VSRVRFADKRHQDMVNKMELKFFALNRNAVYDILLQKICWIFQHDSVTKFGLHGHPNLLSVPGRILSTCKDKSACK